MDDSSILQWIASARGAEAWDLCKSLQGFPRSDLVRFALTPSQLHFLEFQVEMALGSAKRKVFDPWNWLWTKVLLEQASDQWTAQETAKDFPKAASVVDGCCGAGVDAVAIAMHLSSQEGLDQRLIAIDSDETACQLTQLNSARNGIPLFPKRSRFEDFYLSKSVWLHLDPDRRVSGRTVNVHATEPSWQAIAKQISQAPGASVKVAPGFQPDLDFQWEQCGPPQARRWISRDSSVRQQRLYWRIPRWENAGRVVSAFRSQTGWHHEVFDSRWEEPMGVLERGAHDSIEQAVDRLDEYTYIADQDPALRAAKCVVALSERLNLKVLGNEFGYCIANEITQHPLLRWFRVIEVLPLDRKKVRAMSRSLKMGRWELKSRNVDVDLIQWRKELVVDTDSQQMGWLLVTKLGRKHICLFCEEV